MYTTDSMAGAPADVSATGFMAEAMRRQAVTSGPNAVLAEEDGWRSEAEAPEGARHYTATAAAAGEEDRWTTSPTREQVQGVATVVGTQAARHLLHQGEGRQTA